MKTDCYVNVIRRSDATWLVDGNNAGVDIGRDIGDPTCSHDTVKIYATTPAGNLIQVEVEIPGIGKDRYG